MRSALVWTGLVVRALTVAGNSTVAEVGLAATKKARGSSSSTS